MNATFFKPAVVLTLAFCILPFHAIQAQQKAPLCCDEERAVLLAEKQVEAVALLKQPQKQIAVMVRAADILWKTQESSARKIFTDAFEIAVQVFKEKGDEIKRDGAITIQVSDQRFVVIQAIVKRDAGWAKQLAVRIAEESRGQAEEKASEAKVQPYDILKGGVQDKVLHLAIITAPVDHITAASLIRNVFAHPMSRELQRALYALAEVNQNAADQLYEEALKTYAGAPVNEFFYLSAYPFGRERIIGADMDSTYYVVPKNFSPNPTLQQLFIETMLHRAEASLKLPEQPIIGSWKMPEAAHLLAAFAHLETIASQSQPSYVNRLAEMKAYLNASLNVETRQATDSVIRLQQGSERRMSGKVDSFAKYLEQAEREANPAKREQALAIAVIIASDDQDINDLIGAARKVDDEKLRKQLLTFIYFKRTQKLIRDGQFVEAMQLAKNIDQLDFRAYLAYEMAVAALKKEAEKARVREILEDVLELAYKAPSTNEKARTLLGVVNLYAKIDKTRAFEVLAEAVKTINQIDNPDFSTSFIYQKIEGKQFGSYHGYPVEGFSLEAVFRLLTPMDFESALWRAQSFTDELQKGLAVLAVVSSCLEENERLKRLDAEGKKKASAETEKPKAKAPAAKPDEAESRPLTTKKPAN